MLRLLVMLQTTLGHDSAKKQVLHLHVFLPTFSAHTLHLFPSRETAVGCDASEQWEPKSDKVMRR